MSAGLREAAGPSLRAVSVIGAAAVALAGLAVAGGPPEPGGETTMMAGVRRIVFVGDSLTDAAAWTGWVMSTLAADGHPGLVMQDAAVAGNKVGMLKARLAADVLALKPDLVVLHIGTNDQLPADAYRHDLEEIVRSVRQAGARMVLMTPPLVRDPARDARLREYGSVVRDLAAQYQCAFVDLHAAFVAARQAGREVLGPDGVHHRIDGWRTMGRCVLDALGCRAPLVETVALYPRSLTDWLIGPPVPWKAGEPYPALPGTTDGWRRFDREAEIAATSWWQVSWLERGGVMPMGQGVVPGSPGAASRDHGAFARAVVTADRAMQTTLRVGGSMGYAVWVNGQLVWEGKTNHGYHPDSDRFPITLRQGDNTITVFSNWLFYVSVGEV